jgi:hypothetical protein
MHGLPREAIHESALALTLPHECEDLIAGVAALSLLPDADVQVRSEERPLVAGGLLHPQLMEDVDGYSAGCRRGEGQYRDAELFLQPLKASIRGSEVMPPLRDAVSLIHDQE